MKRDEIGGVAGGLSRFADGLGGEAEGTRVKGNENTPPP